MTTTAAHLRALASKHASVNQVLFFDEHRNRPVRVSDLLLDEADAIEAAEVVGASSADADDCWCGADGGEGCYCCTDDCPEDCVADHQGEQ